MTSSFFWESSLFDLQGLRDNTGVDEFFISIIEENLVHKCNVDIRSGILYNNRSWVFERDWAETEKGEEWNNETEIETEIETKTEIERAMFIWGHQ